MMTDGVSTSGTTGLVDACEVEKKKAPVKVKFTPEEDAQLLRLVQQFGAKDWIRISSLIGTRNPRQCRERYKNYVNPELRVGDWTKEEDRLIEEKFHEMGAKWNRISKFFVNRSDNAIRNRWMMIARHKAKAMAHPPTVPAFSPPSPPSVVRPHPQPIVTLPVVIPIVKETPAYQMPWPGDSFEMESSLDTLDTFGSGSFDVWSGFDDF